MTHKTLEQMSQEAAVEQMTRTEKQEAIDAKYNELCSALTAFDFHLRELTGMFDPQIDNILERTQGVHDLLMEIDEKLVDEFGE